MAQAAVTVGEQSVLEGTGPSARLEYSQRWVFLLPPATALVGLLPQVSVGLLCSPFCAMGPATPGASAMPALHPPFRAQVRGVCVCVCVCEVRASPTSPGLAQNQESHRGCPHK